MAKEQAKKPNRIVEIFRTEYRWESFLLLALSIIVLNLFGLLVKETIVINTEVSIVGPILGTYPLVTKIVLAVLGGVGLLVAVWPILKPSLRETSKLSYPTRSDFVGNVTKVMCFILFLVGIFVLYDTVISKLISTIS